MLPISTYQDLLTEIKVYENRLSDLEREDYALRRIEYNRIELDVYLKRKTKVNNEAAIIQAVLEDKRDTQRTILNKLKQLEGLEYQIAYKRFIEGKALDQVADELGYEYNYIKKKSMETNKRLR